MKRILVLTIMVCIFLTACGQAKSIGIIGGADGPTAIFVTEKVDAMYEQITGDKAKEIMDSGEPHIILDVREKEEFNEGHIPGAVQLSYTEIETKAGEVLPDKDSLILVYCRSGRRSKIAVDSLVNLGYTNIKEFGGIIDWQYEIEK